MILDSSWNVTAHGDTREGKWRGNWRMEWVSSTLHTTSEHGVSSITTADAHTSAASSRLNWRPRRFKWTRPFRRKTKSGFCACAITFQMASTTGKDIFKQNEKITTECRLQGQQPRRVTRDCGGNMCDTMIGWNCSLCVAYVWHYSLLLISKHVVAKLWICHAVWNHQFLPWIVIDQGNLIIANFSRFKSVGSGNSWSPCPRGLRRRSAAARLLRS